MKVALTVWEDRISPLFDSAGMLLVADIDRDGLSGRRLVPFAFDSPLTRAARLADLGIKVLICGGISESYANLIEVRGIRIVPFAAGPVERVLEAYLNGNLDREDFRMPGCETSEWDAPSQEEESVLPGRYLFGPVPSRRFGRSLGVDLTPYKTCTLDCVFCQLGRTTHKTVAREEYVPTEAVISEIRAWLDAGGEADYITLSGSGEPTLHSRFGEVIEFIRTHSRIPTVLLTNGTLLYLPEVREAAAEADVVKISLSAWNQASYGWVNRPHPNLEFSQLTAGEKAFRDCFKGRLWLEVFLVAGMNATAADVSRIAALADEIRPDRIQLNSAVRPPAEEFAGAVSAERLQSFCPLFRPQAEIIPEFHPGREVPVHATRETIFSMLERRPCTADQIASGFGMHLNEVSKYLGNLLRSGRIRMERKNGTVYYAPSGRGKRAGGSRNTRAASVRPKG
ncbi:Putative radical SAM domain-containing transcription regulator TrmB (modular protein) [uncultured Desulfatiglans sp.]|nr:Putative radical SAM domain-containing transcription regulator TrmB (modular protein) [uncultured Desulfatiglans sp.]